MDHTPGQEPVKQGTALDPLPLPGPPRRPGIKDVAALAGVSWKTVSNVINGSAPVREQTRARVEAAVAELGYRPNLSGRHLRQGRSHLLALAFPEIRNPYFADLAHAVILTAQEHGYTVLIDETFADAGRERVVAEGFHVHLLDGVLFSPQALALHDVVAVRGNLPMVMIGEHALPARGEPAVVDHVVIDNTASAREATAHLLETGRRRIAFLGGEAGLSSGTGALRRAGYEAALNAAGLTATSTFLAAQYTRPVGAATVSAGIAAFQGPDAIDALLCANDQLAVGAMHALREAGLRVPQDVAVLGWDDIEEGRYSHPTLTSVSPDVEALAQLAVELLVSRIEGSREPPRVHIVAHTLEVRESTAPATPAPTA
ncbi:transcriptional regulator, LacI family [Beutenbergia cavernae DSM 12333]|uniref:Transcriptional regulator, LacI family n=1 Tax=Beutenbergia cavernae (strain ATCC BAA-8 / DSM 12333 / CCUG 43141 / JCM 11478 / NBRC 16432 / NCIMB 13614 / HKI 0122) TaxID=471853 RepID=C5BZ07_BEUC1|nr:LacI family DNA-binding transcriptional regulator [Beutenbergia cavernae]ACQ81122.1 transcriptional regulator, LacI family [Beutenbergia cavernae DSM 12333]